MASTTAGSDTSSRLLARLRARDAEAWDRLAELYGPLVFYWCRRFGLQDQGAADVLQEVFSESVASLLGIPTLRPEKWPRFSAENRCPVTEQQWRGGDIMKRLDHTQKTRLHSRAVCCDPQ
jgi:hypothetical protein